MWQLLPSTIQAVDFPVLSVDFHSVSSLFRLDHIKTDPVWDCRGMDHQHIYPQRSVCHHCSVIMKSEFPPAARDREAGKLMEELR